ncbi:MAG: hypothetical protein AB1451_09470 [Nitrospirota bacterium]
MERAALAIPARLIGFVISPVAARIAPAGPLASKPSKAAPNYGDLMPRQQMIESTPITLASRRAIRVVKTYDPGFAVAEISMDVDDLLTDPLFELHTELIDACRAALVRLGGDLTFEEEYRVYCIANYQGDPEVFLTLHGERLVGLIKDERLPLDEEEVRATLQANIKYGKDDLIIVDWDGAILFDPQADFEANIELIEIANLQLLRLRMSDHALDRRLAHIAQMLRTTPMGSRFRRREIRAVLREILKIRAETLLESQAAEHRIKLIGDWYAARVYALLAKKFHLEAWQTSIQQKLDAIEDVSTMVAENFSVSFHTTLDFILIGGWFLLLAGWFVYLFLDLYLLSLR